VFKRNAKTSDITVLSVDKLLTFGDSTISIDTS